MLVIFVLTFIIQAANNAVNPIISLYWPTLTSTQRLVLLSGVVSTLLGITVVMRASLLGKYGDQCSQLKLLMFGLSFGILIDVP